MIPRAPVLSDRLLVPSLQMPPITAWFPVPRLSDRPNWNRGRIGCDLGRNSPRRVSSSGRCTDGLCLNGISQRLPACLTDHLERRQRGKLVAPLLLLAGDQGGEGLG